MVWLRRSCGGVALRHLEADPLGVHRLQRGEAGGSGDVVAQADEALAHHAAERRPHHGAIEPHLEQRERGVGAPSRGFGPLEVGLGGGALAAPGRGCAAATASRGRDRPRPAPLPPAAPHHRCGRAACPSPPRCPRGRGSRRCAPRRRAGARWTAPPRSGRWPRSRRSRCRSSRRPPRRRSPGPPPARPRSPPPSGRPSCTPRTATSAASATRNPRQLITGFSPQGTPVP